FDARPVGTKGKHAPLPGKTDGAPKDDVDKLNQTTSVGLNA
ncbi:amino acid ABC transporter permease, partial [Bifidobacterium breve]|nr:amino acid ABC transporter permease [Bifidobacterium breve]